MIPNRACWLTALVMVAALAGLGGPSSGVGPPPLLTPEVRAKGQAIARLDQRWRAAARAGKLKEADPPLRQMLALQQALYGKNHPERIVPLANLVAIAEGLGQWREAIAAARERVEVMERLYGANHFRSVDARQLVADVQLRGQLTPEKRAALRQATQLLTRAMQLSQQGKHQAALPLARRGVGLRKELLGQKHPVHARGLIDLAVVYHRMGDRHTALPLYKQALAIQQQAQGEAHPDRATPLANVALLCKAMGEPRAALALSWRALQLRQQVLGEAHPEYLDALARHANEVETLATTHHKAGERREALALYLRALEVRQGAGREDGPDQARNLNNLALLYQAMGDTRGLLAVERRRLTAPGKRRPDYAMQLTQLAMRHEEAGEQDGALALHQEALAVTLRARGEAHPETGDKLHNLARHYWVMGNYRASLPVARRALAARKLSRDKAPLPYADSLHTLALAHANLGEHPAALPLFAEARELRRRVRGENHVDHAASLHDLGRHFKDLGEHQAALRVYRLAMEVTWPLREKKGSDHSTHLANLADAYDKLGQHAAALSAYRRAIEVGKRFGDRDLPLTLHRLAYFHSERGEHKESLRSHQEALALRKKAVGEAHPDYAESLVHLAHHYATTADFASAEALYQQALAIHQKANGEAHPRYATTLLLLGMNHAQRGEYKTARALAERSMALRKRGLGEKHADYAVALNDLAKLCFEMGDYREAIPLLRQSVVITEKALGKKHPALAVSLDNLGATVKAIGDTSGALDLHLRAQEIFRAAGWQKHSQFTNSLNLLANTLSARGEPKAALPVYRQYADLTRQALGERHFRYAHALHNIGTAHWRLGDRKAALPHFRQANDILKASRGEAHPDYATSLQALAQLTWEETGAKAALPLATEALKVTRHALGEAHPDTIHRLRDMALLHRALGEDKEALRLVTLALSRARGHAELTAAVLPERQQLLARALQRECLDVFLSHSSPAADQYTEALAWKGAVFLAQHGRRKFQLHAQSKDAQVRQLVERLDRATRQLAALTFAPVKDSSIVRSRLAELTKEKEAAEAELVRRSAEASKGLPGQRLSPTEMQKLLPEGVVLVDYHEYAHYPSAKEQGKPRQHLTAFVVRKDVLARVDLGEMASIVKDIALWRGSIERRIKPCEGKDDPAHRLREKLWRPLEKHLRGAKTVLVSPDGALARLPFAALPGSKDEVYLIEELVLATLPVPQLLPEALAPLPAPGKKGPSLLLVGDVDHDDRDDKATTPTDNKRGPGATRKWQKLEATRAEAAAIRDSFEDRHDRSVVTFLRRERPTTSAVREAAPAHRFLHLATHGFFTPKQTRSALGSSDPRRLGDRFAEREAAGWHPGLLSGLVLAGANKPTEKDTGILTALEVAELDLSGCELAVLSACETGLGEVAGGEGVLGLQRAFQVAGARATVCSLWEVGDQATRQLMVAFYARLWGRKRPLGKAEALAEAQRLMLKEGLKRNMVRKDKVPQGEQRVPPFFWAAFVVAGDWR